MIFSELIKDIQNNLNRDEEIMTLINSLRTNTSSTYREDTTKKLIDNIQLIPPKFHLEIAKLSFYNGVHNLLFQNFNKLIGINTLDIQIELIRYCQSKSFLSIWNYISYLDKVTISDYKTLLVEYTDTFPQYSGTIITILRSNIIKNLSEPDIIEILNRILNKCSLEAILEILPKISNLDYDTEKRILEISLKQIEIKNQGKYDQDFYSGSSFVNFLENINNFKNLKEEDYQKIIDKIIFVYNNYSFHHGPIYDTLIIRELSQQINKFKGIKTQQYEDLFKIFIKNSEYLATLIQNIENFPILIPNINREFIKKLIGDKLVTPKLLDSILENMDKLHALGPEDISSLIRIFVENDENYLKVILINLINLKNIDIEIAKILIAKGYIQDVIKNCLSEIPAFKDLHQLDNFIYKEYKFKEIVKFPNIISEICM